MVLFAAITLACEPMTTANFVRSGVPLDSDSTGTSACVIPHGDSVPKVWPATLMVEESDTVRFRVEPRDPYKPRGWWEPEPGVNNGGRRCASPSASVGANGVVRWLRQPLAGRP